MTATIRAKGGEASQFWRVTAFSETAQAELMRLVEGHALSAQGAFKAELYQPEGGEPRVSLSIVADHVLALRQPPRERKAKTSGDALYRGGAAAFDDSMSAEQIRAELCAKFPADFEAGYCFGLTGDSQPPCDAAGYPIGFREWPLDRRNAWWAGWNLGHAQRQADHG